jgi:hypothetical protein
MCKVDVISSSMVFMPIFIKIRLLVQKLLWGTGAQTLPYKLMLQPSAVTVLFSHCYHQYIHITVTHNDLALPSRKHKLADIIK